ncbi:MAG: hypothetical protein FWC27_07170 [Firmicutes bacterium]|nr:hypothetical protein [Bacillota bacterium]
MRRFLSLLLVCLLPVCLFACNRAQPAAVDTTETTTETTTEATTEPTTEPPTTTQAPATTTITSTRLVTTTQKPTVVTQTPTTTAPPQNAVPKKYVGSAKSGELTWEQYQQALAEAERLVGRYAGQSLEARLEGVYTQLRAPVDSGAIEYSMEKPHYADPYGYLILKVASCAGSARTAGLCLDVLGIPWEHVNPGAFTHQWARVNVNGVYWICDPYGMYVGPEPAPYKHPYIET